MAFKNAIGKNFEDPILVLGDGGFIGRALVRSLLKEKYVIVGASRGKVSGNTYPRFRLDINDQLQIRYLIREIRPSIVVNLVGERARLGPISEYRTAINTHVLGSLNIAEAILGAEIHCRLLNIGTCEVFGNSVDPFQVNSMHNPITGYSFSKSVSEQLLKILASSYGLDFMLLNPSVAYGPGQSSNMFIPEFIKSTQQGKKFKMSLGEQTRDFVYIDDLIRAITKSFNNWSGSACLTIGSGKSVSMNELAELICRKMGVDPKIAIDPIRNPYRHNEIMSYEVDPSVAIKKLNWNPIVTLDEGINETIRFLTGR